MDTEDLKARYTGVIEEITALTSQVRLLKDEDTTDLDMSRLDEIEIVVGMTVSFLKSTDITITSAAQLDNLSTYLDGIKSQLETMRDAGVMYESNLAAAHTNTQHVKSVFPHLLPRPTETGVEQLREAVVKARQSAAQHSRILNDEYRNAIAEIKDTHSQEIQKLNTLLTEKSEELNCSFGEQLAALETELNQKRGAFESQFTEKQDELAASVSSATAEVAALKTLSSETNESINTQKDRLDTAISEFQRQFSERIGEYQRQFSDAEEDRRNKLEKSIQSRDDAYAKETKRRDAELKTWRDGFTNALDSDREQFATTSDELLTQLRDYAQEAKVTVGLMSEKSLQNDFITQADKEGDRAWSWNLATFASVVLLLAAIGYIFYHTFVNPLPSTNGDYAQVLSKFLITIVIGVIARWTSRQANRHLAEERRLRKLALELATINPFLNNLPDEIKFKVKEVLAMRYYGNTQDEKTPFGEVGPIIQDGESGLKGIPEAIVDTIRGRK